MKLIVITGPMASGKSTVSSLICKENLCENIDADLVVHDLYKAGSETSAKIAEHFGADVLDEKGVNRAALAKKLKTEWDWKDLESIVHPDAHAEVTRRIEEQRAKGKAFCTLELPALPRVVSWFDGADMIIICDTTRDKLLVRAKERGLSENQAAKRLDRQLSSNELKGAAELKKIKSVIIDTGASIEKTHEQLKNLFANTES